MRLLMIYSNQYTYNAEYVCLHFMTDAQWKKGILCAEPRREQKFLHFFQAYSPCSLTKVLSNVLPKRILYIQNGRVLHLALQFKHKTQQVKTYILFLLSLHSGMWHRSLKPRNVFYNHFRI